MVVPNKFVLVISTLPPIASHSCLTVLKPIPFPEV